MATIRENGCSHAALKINESSPLGPSYVNRLSSREMESLTAICDTLIPSIKLPSTTTPSVDDIAFFRTSASDIGTPDRLGGVMFGPLKHPMVWLLRLALWLLSTWYGTFAMCGRASLSKRFPFFQRFSQVEPHKREQILLSFCFSSLFYWRLLFKALKFLVCFVYFTQVDERQYNPSWKAIGYCGPDPDRKQEHQDDGEEAEEHGPLSKALLHLNSPPDSISATLRAAGFPVFQAAESPSLTIDCDVVVVGSGCGGGVVAGVLAGAGYKVLVLEKGSYVARHDLSLLEGPSMDQMYENAGILPTEDLGLLVLAGSAVGGGSAINWSASLRTPAHVLAEWCNSHRLALFGSRAYQEALDTVCAKMGVQSEYEREGLNNAVLRRGCLELGYPVKTIPRNSPADHYCGWCCFGCKDGRKKGTHETWLVDLANSGNGLILPRCKASRVLLQKRKKGSCRKTKKAVGVVFEFENRVYVARSKVTMVASGALGTPVLLRRSGLRNPHIGKHLHLHPVVMAWGYFPEEEKKKSYEGGIMTAMSTVVADFKGSGYGAVIQTPALHPGMFSVLMPWVSGEDFKRRMGRFDKTAHIFALARDRGEGEVTEHKGSVRLRYKFDRRDEESLGKGMEKLLRILAAAGAEEVGTQHCGAEAVDVKRASSHEVERFVRRAGGRGLGDLKTPVSSAHQMGSCRMGAEEEGSVVDERGEAWEVEDLFVADASVLPTALGVNPMVTVQAIAYCTARSVLEVLGGKRK